MGVISISPEESNIGQAVSIYIFKEEPKTFLGIILLYLLFNYDGYQVYEILDQKDIVSCNYDKIGMYVKNYVDKKKI